MWCEEPISALRNTLFSGDVVPVCKDDQESLATAKRRLETTTSEYIGCYGDSTDTRDLQSTGTKSSSGSLSASSTSAAKTQCAEICTGYRSVVLCISAANHC